MRIGNRNVDHIVIGAPSLTEGIEYVGDLLRVDPQIGGRHLTKGTCNALVNLGNRCYLEILAPDLENREYKGPRWMGIDTVTQPTIIRWALSSKDLHKDLSLLSGYKQQLSQSEQGSRFTSSGNKLTWQMSIPAMSPLVELAPFLTDWSGSKVHPCDNLPKVCQLKEVTFDSTEPDKIQPLFDQLGLNIKVYQGENRIRLKVEGANGEVLL